MGARIPAGSGLFALNWEISVQPRMRGGAGSQFGAIRIELGNLRLCRTAWWGWDSNLQPNDREQLALSIAVGMRPPCLSKRLKCR